MGGEAVESRGLDPVREVLTDRIAGSPIPGASAGGACRSVPLEVRAGARRASRSRRSRWPALPPGPEAVHGRKRSVAWTAVWGVPELRTSTLTCTWTRRMTGWCLGRDKTGQEAPRGTLAMVVQW